VANKSKKEGESEEEGGEFADFMADISLEIAQRVESLDTKPKALDTKPKALDTKPKAPDTKPKAPPEERKKTPAPPDAGLIAEWPSIADRMIEEMR
jgi:hypothetical protein